MLKNEQQLAGARKKLADLQAARVEESSDDGVAVLSELIEDVQRGIADYVTARDGVIKSFRVDSLDELGPALIRARLAAGWTQKELAERLGVTEQQVSKDEAREYQSAGLAKVADVLDVLGYELAGEVRPSAPRVLPDQAGAASSSVTSWHPVALHGGGVVRFLPPGLGVGPVRFGAYGGGILSYAPVNVALPQDA